jgi:hypothetical protein
MHPSLATWIHLWQLCMTAAFIPWKCIHPWKLCQCLASAFMCFYYSCIYVWQQHFSLAHESIPGNKVASLSSPQLQPSQAMAFIPVIHIHPWKVYCIYPRQLLYSYLTVAFISDNCISSEASSFIPGCCICTFQLQLVSAFIPGNCIYYYNVIFVVVWLAHFQKSFFFVNYLPCQMLFHF